MLILSFSSNTKGGILYYPILEKVIMWIHIQSKIILKMEDDFWKSIIYTATKMKKIVRTIIRYS